MDKMVTETEPKDSQSPAAMAIKTEAPMWLWVALMLLGAAVIVLGMLFNSRVGDIFPSVENVSDGESIRAAFGSLGDTFGGLLNPLLTFVMVLFLLHTMRQNQQMIHEAQETNRQTKAALDVTREELELSREEMELTRGELAASAAAQKELSETQKHQRFESTFFSLLQTHISRQDQLSQQVESKTYSLIDGFISSAESSIMTQPLDKIQVSLRERYGDVFQYLRFLVRTLKIVDQQATDPTEYIELIRSATHQRFLEAMIYVSPFLTQDVSAGYKGLLESHKFFVSLDFDPIPDGEPLPFKRRYAENHIKLIECWDMKVFGNRANPQQRLQEYKKFLQQ